MSIQPADPARTAALLAALDAYRPARAAFLAALGLPESNRDPFAELGERLVAALTGGRIATSRIQVAHDLVLGDGTTVQVRYLANPAGSWVNEHVVHNRPGVDRYALVLLEAFTVVGVLAFPTGRLAAIGQALGKRHPRQDETLQFTRRNWWTIRDNPNQFRSLGMQVWLPPLV
jgi:hypothetical protein